MKDNVEISKNDLKTLQYLVDIGKSHIFQTIRKNISLGTDEEGEIIQNLNEKLEKIDKFKEKYLK